MTFNLINIYYLQLHKLVLLCASPFLASHSNDITERMLTITLDIEVGASALKDFVSYLYFGALHLTSENIQPIEALAKLLKVEAIIQFCSEFRMMFGMPISEDDTVSDADETVGALTEAPGNGFRFDIKLTRAVPTKSMSKVGEVYEDLTIIEDENETMEEDIITVNSCTPDFIEDKTTSAITLKTNDDSPTDLTEPTLIKEATVESER